MRRVVAGCLAASVCAGAHAAPARPLPAKLLLQHPSLSRDLITFDYGGEIWTVPRAGGAATPLVVGQVRNSRPVFVRPAYPDRKPVVPE